MHLPNIILWCYVLLVVSFSDSRGNSSLEISTNNVEQRGNLMEYDFFSKDSDRMRLILYNLFNNFLNKNSSQNNRKNWYDIIFMNKNRMDSVWSHESHEHVKIHEENNQISMESRANFTEVINEDNSTKTLLNIVSYEAYGNETCIQLCCPFGDRLTSKRECVAGQNNYSFPDVYQNNSKSSKKLNELFQLTIRNPCVLRENAHRILSPDKYLLLINGSLYRNDSNELVPSMSYCLVILDRNIYDAIICLKQPSFSIFKSVCFLTSSPFLLLTFVVYSILPEVQNVHSCTLRVYIASLLTTNIIMFFVQEIPELSEWKYCIPLGTACVNYIM